MIGITLVDRYELLSELGRGGMGVVYRARDRLLERDVAVKLLPVEGLAAEGVERFRREMRTVARFDHPGIVPVHDAGQHEGHLFFVMPVVTGTSLRGALREGGLSREDVVDVCVQVAEALAYSHSLGVVHRDVKPENIMVSRASGGRPRARLMDFGLAFEAGESSLTKTGVVCGTVLYLSPEQVQGGPIDGRTDVYSLGSVLYECLVGAPPFTGTVPVVLYRIGNELPAEPRSLGVQLDPQLEQAVLRALAKEPRMRQTGAAEFASELSRLATPARTPSDTGLVTAAIPVKGQRLVGREREIDALLQQARSLTRTGARIVVVEGGAGAGKTFLVDELERRVCATGCRVLRGTFMEPDGAIPFEGFCEALERYFRGRSQADVVGEIGDAAEELVRLLPPLGDLEAFRSGPRQVAPERPEDAPENARKSAFEVLARTLSRIARNAGLVLILENLHQADVSVDALKYLLRRLAASPVLFVGTCRGSSAGRTHPLATLLSDLAGDSRATTLRLDALAGVEYARLVAQLLGGEAQDQLVDEAFEVTDGNPLFTRELLKALDAKRDLCHDERGLFALTPGTRLTGEALPASLRAAVDRSYQRLPETARRLLSIAAVAGKSFDLSDVEEVGKLEADTDADVSRLVEEGILREESGARGDRYAFTGALVRETAQAALPRRTRRSIHRLFGELLERRHGGARQRVSVDLFRHFSEADVPAKAVEYGLEAARQALESGGAEDAIQVARAVAGFVETDAGRGEASLILARAQRSRGDYEAAMDEAGKAAEAFEHGGDPRTVDACLVGAEAAWDARQPDRVERWIERGLEVPDVRERPRVHLRLQRLAATAATLRGDAAASERHLSELQAEEAPPTSATQGNRPSGTINVPLSGVDELDPIGCLYLDQAEAMTAVFECLTRIGADGRAKPFLASDIDDDGTGLKYRIRLRDGVLFHDGRPLQTPDVRWSMERYLRDAGHSVGQRLRAIHGVQAVVEGRARELAGFREVDDREFILNLDEPCPALPFLLSDVCLAIVPRDSQPLSEGDWREGLVGTGPFRVVRFQPGSRLELERNPRYWRPGLPRSERLVFHFGLDPAEVVDGFRTGKLSVTGSLPARDLEALRSDKNVHATYVDSPTLSTCYIAFNTHRGPMANEEIRRSVRNALDVDSLIAPLGTAVAPASGLIPPGLPGYRPRSVTSRSGPVAVPVALNEEITLVVHDVFGGPYATLLQTLLERLKSLGLNVRTTSRKGATESLDVDLVTSRIIADFPDPDAVIGDVLESTSGYVGCLAGSPEIDRVIESARTEQDPAVRNLLYSRIEEALERDVRLIPLFHEKQWRLARPEIGGLEVQFCGLPVAYEKLSVRR